MELEQDVIKNGDFYQIYDEEEILTYFEKCVLRNLERVGQWLNHC